MQLTTRGTWPGEITLRQGWAKAVARPWNEHVPDAQLRSIRGSARFIEDCATYLEGLGVGGVTSPPLPEGSGLMWRTSGFRPYLTLDLFSRDLAKPVRPPSHVVLRGMQEKWDEAVSVDAMAFDPIWQLGPIGLAEARRATSRSEFLVVTDGDGHLAGFAVVGAGGAVAYLQRVAVHPDYRGQGYGRSLVRECLRWGQSHGGRTMLLNTQPENTTAAALYLSEGFGLMGSGLEVLRRPAEDDQPNTTVR